MELKRSIFKYQKIWLKKQLLKKLNLPNLNPA
jgi:hypothetical protein